MGELNVHREIEFVVREAQDRALARRELERAPLDERLAALHAARRSRVLARGRVRGAADVLALAAGILLLVRARAAEPGPLAFTVDGAGGFHFSEGSNVIKAPLAVARISEVTDHGAAIVLERGSVHTHVVPHAGNRWRIEAGPYRVTVKGTRFDTTWSPETRTLRVAMQQGRVLVTGDCLGSGRSLSAGEVAEIRCPARAEPPASMLAEIPPVVAAPSSEPSRETHALPRSAPPPPSGPLASSAVVGAATTRSVIAAPMDERHASAEQAMRLANDARQGGERDVAERAYRDVRARFAGSPQAAEATFLLARMLARDARTAEAESLFVAYTQQAPNGTFSEEAWGRLLELARERGDSGAARERARIYLERFPRGASADMAHAAL